MHTTNRRMVAVAAIVCGFAVGMAGLLNYFKYRSTANRLVTERLVVTGRSVETVVHLSLDLGLQFGEIATLPETLERERGTDDLIQGIDIFDNEGKLLYSSDKSRTGSVPDSWLKAVAAAHGTDWLVEDERESAAGMPLKNSFGITLAHVALRFSQDTLVDENAGVARELAATSFIIFALATLIASFALNGQMRRLTQGVAQAEAALMATDEARAVELAARTPFGAALQRFIANTRSVERQLAKLRNDLEQGARP
jgi:hypothetical protein